MWLVEISNFQVCLWFSSCPVRLHGWTMKAKVTYWYWHKHQIILFESFHFAIWLLSCSEASAFINGCDSVVSTPYCHFLLVQSMFVLRSMSSLFLSVPTHSYQSDQCFWSLSLVLKAHKCFASSIFEFLRMNEFLILAFLWIYILTFSILLYLIISTCLVQHMLTTHKNIYLCSVLGKCSFNTYPIREGEKTSSCIGNFVFTFSSIDLILYENLNLKRYGNMMHHVWPKNKMLY